MNASTVLRVPNEIVQQVLERTSRLSEVPAPSNAEGRRATIVAGWWRDDGLAGVDIDEAGNVWGCARQGTDEAILVAAHLDTVFGDDTPHITGIDGDRMYGPGVGDNTVGVAALSTLAALLPRTTNHAIWVLATTGEEGLGNLAGITHALSNSPQTAKALIAVEGNYLGRVATRGVGSLRLSIEVEGPGGHAWEDSDRPSATHVVGELVEASSRLRSPGDRSVSVNVGRLWGGESINARARRAGFDIDLRADDGDALDRLESGLAELLESVDPDIRIATRLLGRRPAGGIRSDHPLVRVADEVLREVGITPTHMAASTDANAAYATGIPAITLGVTTGGGEHTSDEWIDLPPLEQGIAALVQTVARYDHGRG